MKNLTIPSYLAFALTVSAQTDPTAQNKVCCKNKMKTRIMVRFLPFLHFSSSSPLNWNVPASMWINTAEKGETFDQACVRIGGTVVPYQQCSIKPSGGSWNGRGVELTVWCYLVLLGRAIFELHNRKESGQRFLGFFWNESLQKSHENFTTREVTLP